MNSSENNLPKAIGRPAASALLAANITSLNQVAKLSDKELLKLHGVGPKAVKILREYTKGCSV